MRRREGYNSACRESGSFLSAAAASRALAKGGSPLSGFFGPEGQTAAGFILAGSCEDNGGGMMAVSESLRNRGSEAMIIQKGSVLQRVDFLEEQPEN